mmetsp:Transcript_13365/g.18420  ORF Transcript_13365/g.18420 Transcript_13365/m.18420 type:complete len:251 (+) Transcript_13365:560-1312(+)
MVSAGNWLGSFHSAAISQQHPRQHHTVRFVSKFRHVVLRIQWIRSHVVSLSIDSIFNCCVFVRVVSHQWKVRIFSVPPTNCKICFETCEAVGVGVILRIAVVEFGALRHKCLHAVICIHVASVETLSVDLHPSFVEDFFLLRILKNRYFRNFKFANTRSQQRFPSSFYSFYFWNVRSKDSLVSFFRGIGRFLRKWFLKNHSPVALLSPFVPACVERRGVQLPSIYFDFLHCPDIKKLVGRRLQVIWNLVS